VTGAAARVRFGSRNSLSIFFALAMSVVAARAGGQEFRATMTGRVTDAQSAVLPGVTIAVTNVDSTRRSTARPTSASTPAASAW
jgi:hypothetical protein